MLRLESADGESRSMPPFFSIIIPSYNNEDLLVECINSALSQTFQDFEIIISDNASDDLSSSIIASYDDRRIKAFAQSTNIGMYKNINFCISKASGAYLKFLCSDDVMHPHCLECIYAAMHEVKKIENQSKPIYIGHDKLASPSASDKWKKSDFRAPIYAQPDSILDLGIGLPDSCVNREHFISSGLFGHPNTRLDFSRDNLSLGIATIGCTQIQIRLPLILERIHNNQSRHNMYATKRYQLDELLLLHTETGWLKKQEGRIWYYSLWKNHFLSALKYLAINRDISYLFHVILIAFKNFPLKLRNWHR